MLVLFIFVFVIEYGFCQKRDVCNWQYDSAYLKDETKPGVIPLELRCLKGYLEWKMPKGGLQVKFKAPVELLGAEFTVRLISKMDIAIFYEETSNNGLKVLRGFQNFDPKSAVHINSKNGEARLYVVIRPKVEKLETSGILRIDYELESNEDLSLMKDCRMCSAEMMAELFCKGDFAVKAKVQNKYIHNDGENVYLDLHVYHVFHQSSQLFLKSYEGGYHIGRVTMLGKCSPPKGRHHYLFLGHLKSELASAHVECYMKFSLWKQIRDQVKCKHSPKREKARSQRDIKEIFHSTEK